MTKDQKIIKGKVGLLELAKRLGNVSQACKMLGYKPSGGRFPKAGDATTTKMTAERCEEFFDNRDNFGSEI